MHRTISSFTAVGAKEIEHSALTGRQFSSTMALMNTIGDFGAFDLFLSEAHRFPINERIGSWTAILISVMPKE
jgi:hypothetical protein